MNIRITCLLLALFCLPILYTDQQSNIFTTTIRLTVAESISDNEQYIADIHEVIVTDVLHPLIENLKHNARVVIREDSFCNQLVIEVSGKQNDMKKVNTYVRQCMDSFITAAANLPITLKTTMPDINTDSGIDHQSYAMQILYIKDKESCMKWVKALNRISYQNQ